MKKQLSALAAALTVVLAFTGCPKGGEVEDVTLESISVNASAAKTVFAVGEEFSYEGILVKGKYSDLTSKTLESSAYTAAVAAANLSEEGKLQLTEAAENHMEEAAVTVTYTADTSKTAKYSITIAQAPTTVEIDKTAVKTTYTVGDEFDTTGIKVTATYGEEKVDVTSAVAINVTGFDSSAAGTVTVKLTATYAGVSAAEVTVDVTVEEPAEEPDYEISFSNTNNSYVYNGSGVYTLTIADANDSEWGNQIFIKNPNKLAGVAKGDLVLATITVKSDKAISTFFFKNQYNGGNYSGQDTSKALEADTETVFQVVGTAADDYDDSSSYVIALRGNAADTTLVISNIKSEVLTDYDVTSVTLEATPASISAGESSTITLKDQYGIAIADATYAITSADPVATLTGNVLIAGESAETVTVTATYGDFTKTVDIEISAEKNYAKYWAPTPANQAGDSAPADYFSIWADQNWCGSYVTLSDMTASATGVALTQTVTGTNWFGTQIWYGVSAASDFTFKVTSTVAGDITINDAVYTLEAGVAKEITLKDVTGKLAIQLGTKEPATQLGDCTFTISDFSVTAAE